MLWEVYSGSTAKGREIRQEKSIDLQGFQAAGEGDRKPPLSLKPAKIKERRKHIVQSYRHRTDFFMIIQDKECISLDKYSKYGIIII